MKWRWLAPLSILGLGLGLRLWPVLLGHALVFGDNYSLMVPGKIFTAWWLRQGVLPMWNPWLFSGLSWIGEINQSVLYPSTAVFMIWSPAVALSLTVLWHLVWSWAGAWWFGRSQNLSGPSAALLASLWSFSTQVTGSINNLSTLQSLVWLPWVFLVGQRVTDRLVEGRRKPGSWQAGWWLGLVVLFQFLGGYPQHVLYSLGAVVAWSAVRHWSEFGSHGWWSWWRLWLVAALWTVALSAVAWLPFAKDFLVSTRTVQTLEQAQVGSLHPTMLVKSVVPYIFDKPVAGMKWGPAWSGQPNSVWYLPWLGWMMVVGVMLSGRLRRPRDLIWFAAVALLVVFSMGSYLPGFEWLQRVMPVFRVGRYPSMALIVVNWLLAWWLAELMDRVNWRPPQAWLRRLWWLSWWGVVLSGAGMLIVWSRFEAWWPLLDGVLSGRLSASAFHTMARDRVILRVLLEAGVSLSVCSLVAVWLWRRGWRWAVVAILTLDLIWHTQAMLFFMPNSVYPKWSEVGQAQLPAVMQLQRQPDAWQWRWLTRNGNLPYTDFGSYWEALVVRAPFSDSFITDSELRTGQHLASLRQGATVDWQLAQALPTIHGYTALLPQDYAAVWDAGAEPRINFINQVALDDPRLAEWSGRYYLVDTWYQVSEELSRYPVVAESGRWQVRELPSALPRVRWLDGQPAQITQWQEQPNRLEFELHPEGTANQVAQLVIADRFDSQWRAWANGRPIPITNHQGMRLLQVPVDELTLNITLIYQPILFYISLVVTIFSMGLGGIWHLLSTRSKTLLDETN